MSHIKVRSIFVLLALFGTVAAHGQAPDSKVLENEEFENARALLQAGRAEIIRDELRMSDEESAAFWSVYEEYHVELRVVRDRQTAVILELLKRYRGGTLTNEYAEKLVKDKFQVRSDLLQVQEKYVSRFREVLPALKVARFYQLEGQMDAQVDAQLALYVPLVESI
jgi:hypothetical protein